MVVKDVFKHLTKSVRAHPFIILLIFINTIAFIGLIAAINIKYQLAIAENLTTIITALEGANYDENAIQAGLPFLSNISQLLENLQFLLSNLKKLVLYQIAAFLAIGLWRWSLIHYLFQKQNILLTWSHLLIRALIFLAPLFIIDYMLVGSVLRQTVEGTQSVAPLYSACALTAAGFYFMFVCLALPLKSLRENLYESFSGGIRKIHYIAPFLIIGWTLIAAAAYLVSLSVEAPFVLMVLAIILFFIIMVAIQIAFVALVQKIAERWP